MRNPYMKFKNPSIHSSWRTDWWAHAQTEDPKPICPVNFFELGGIINVPSVLQFTGPKKMLRQNLNWENIGHFGVLRQSLIVFGHCFFMGIIIRIIKYLPVCQHVSQISHLLAQTTLLYHCHAFLFNIYLFPTRYHRLSPTTWLYHCHASLFNIYLYATMYHRYHICYHKLHDCTTAMHHYSILTCLAPGITDITPVITYNMTVPLPCIIIQYLPVCHQVSQISHLLSPTTWLYHCLASLFNIYLFATRYHRYHTCYHLQHDCTTATPHHSIFTCLPPCITDITPVITNYIIVPMPRLIIQYLPVCHHVSQISHLLSPTTWLYPCHASSFNIYLFATRYHRYHTCYHLQHDCTTVTPHYSIFTCLPPGITDITPVITYNMTVPLSRLIIQYLPVCHQVSQISHLLSPTTWLYHCHASLFNIYLFGTRYHRYHTCYHQLHDCTTVTPHHSILSVCHQISQISHLLSPTTWLYHCHASSFNIYQFATRYHRYHTCYHLQHDCTTAMHHYSIFISLPPGITDITPVITYNMHVPLPCIIIQYLSVCHHVSQISHVLSPTTWLYHCHASLFNIYQFATMYHRYHTCYHLQHDCTTAMPHHSIFISLPPGITDITPVITYNMTVPLPCIIIQYLPVCHQVSQISHLLSQTTCTWLYHCHASSFNIYLFATRYHRYHTCYHQLHDCTTVMPHQSIFTCLPPGITDITPVITNNMTVPMPCLIIQYLPVCHQVSQISHLLSPTTWLYHCHASLFNIYLFATMYHRYHTCYPKLLDCTTATHHQSIFTCLPPGITYIIPVITNYIIVPLPCVIIQYLPVCHQVSQISHLLLPTIWLYHWQTSLFNIYPFATRYHRYHTLCHQLHDCTTAAPHYSIFTCLQPGTTDITPVITNYMIVPLPCLIVQYLPVCHQVSQISHLLLPTTGFYYCHASLFNIYLFATMYHRYHICYNQLQDSTTVMPHYSISTCLPPCITDITSVITNYRILLLSCLIIQYLFVCHQVSQISHLL